MNTIQKVREGEKCCGCESQQIVRIEYEPNSILIIFFNVFDKVKIAQGLFYKETDYEYNTDG